MDKTFIKPTVSPEGEPQLELWVERIGELPDWFCKLSLRFSGNLHLPGTAIMLAILRADTLGHRRIEPAFRVFSILFDQLVSRRFSVFAHQLKTKVLTDPSTDLNVSWETVEQGLQFCLYELMIEQGFPYLAPDLQFNPLVSVTPHDFRPIDFSSRIPNASHQIRNASQWFLAQFNLENPAPLDVVTFWLRRMWPDWGKPHIDSKRLAKLIKDKTGISANPRSVWQRAWRLGLMSQRSPGPLKKSDRVRNWRVS